MFLLILILIVVVRTTDICGEDILGNNFLEG